MGEHVEKPMLNGMTIHLAENGYILIEGQRPRGDNGFMPLSRQWVFTNATSMENFMREVRDEKTSGYTEFNCGAGAIGAK